MKLKSEYLKFLKKHEKKPTKIRSVIDVQSYKKRIKNVFPNTTSQELGKIIKALQKPSYNKIIEILADDAEKDLQGLKNTTFNYYAGEFPTGEVNACVVSVKDGFLILINSGLIDFLGKFSRLMALSITSCSPNVHNIAAVNADKSSVQKFNQSNFALGKLVITYILLGSVDGMNLDLPKFTPKTAPEVEYYRMEVLGNMEAFIMLHEFSHILLGHLDEADTTYLASPKGKIPILTKSLRQEYQADLYALMLMERACMVKVGSNSELAKTKLWHMLSGIIGFLCLVDLLETISNLITNQQAATEPTHPPAISRIRSILSNTASGKNLLNAPSVKFTLSWYELVSPMIISLAKEVLS